MEKKGPALESTQWLQIATIIVVCFVVYSNALFNDYVYDDHYQVLKNPWIKGLRYLPEIFSTNVWSFQARGSNYYRPLMHLIYMVGYYLFGLRAWGFHLINILWHAGTSILVFLVISRTMKEARPSLSFRYLSPPFVAALLFAAHPIHTEVVATVMGVVDLSMTFFYLLSFYFYIQGGGKSATKHFLAALSCFLAFLCKEPALTLPVLLLLYDYAFNREGFRRLAFLKRYIPYLTVVCVYLLLRLNALKGFVPWGHQKEVSIPYLSNVFPLFSLYLEKLLLPVKLNFLHTFQPLSSFPSVRGVTSFLIIFGFGVLTLLTLKKNRVAFLGLLFIFLPLLPALYLPALSQEIRHAFAERYLYLPSFGFVLLVATATSLLKESGRVAVAWVVAATIILYGVGTMSRNPVWKDDYTLFSDTVKKSPDDPVARDGLGHALLDSGKTDEAMEQLQLALTLKPDYANAYNSLGTVYRKKGRIDQAIEQYQQAIRLEPNFAYAHYNLANAYDEMGYIDQAVIHFQIALRLKLSMPEVHNNLGIAYAKKGWIDQAIAQFEAAVALDPKTPSFRDNLVRAYRTKALIDKSRR